MSLPRKGRIPVGPHQPAPHVQAINMPPAGTADFSRTSGPGAGELFDFVHDVAADTRRVTSFPVDPLHRTWRRLTGPGGSEAWLIAWPPGTATGWHDHGEAYGAFATAAGTLTEHSLSGRLPTEDGASLQLSEKLHRERRLTALHGKSFGRNLVHNLYNPSETEHALSVHAYFPLLSMMRRYIRVGSVLRFDHIEYSDQWS